MAIPQTRDLTDTYMIKSDSKFNIVSWLSWLALGFAPKKQKKEKNMSEIMAEKL